MGAAAADSNNRSHLRSARCPTLSKACHLYSLFLSSQNFISHYPISQRRKLRRERVRDLPICTSNEVMGLESEPGKMGLLPHLRISCCFQGRRAVNVGGLRCLRQFQGPHC